MEKITNIEMLQISGKKSITNNNILVIGANSQIGSAIIKNQLNG